ncbi:MAG TPA: HAD-IA family hydrolase [Polyangiaceae bacterium]
MLFEELSDPLTRFGGFIFDCDGTLADTMPLHHRSWVHALGRAGAHFEFGWELFQSRAGMSLERTVYELNLQFGTMLDPVRVALDQRDYYTTRSSEVTPVAPVLALAREAAKARSVSVASGSEYRHVVHTLELIGARAWFEVIVTPADVERGKPAPDMFLLAAARMGVPPEHCLVLEDSPLGIEAARAAGMHSALVRHPLARETPALERAL